MTISSHIEIEQNGHSDRNIDYETKKTNPDKEAFDISRAINEIFRHIKQLTKKSE